MSTARWLAEARRAADRPRAAGRVPLWLDPGGGPIEVGSIDDAVAARMRRVLPITPHAGGWCLSQGQRALDAAARWLLAHDLGVHRRPERLAVVPAGGGAPIASVERGVVRVLGIATVAVHLIGVDADGERVWVQQRSLDKATDPGMWDTLMGGQVAHDETVQGALVRETMEEAGLDAGAFASLDAAPPVVVRRPVREGEMVERIDVFVATLAPGMAPKDLDGEVVAFDCLAPAALASRHAAGDFTLEATLIHGAWLERHHPALLAD